MLQTTRCYSEFCTSECESIPPPLFFFAIGSPIDSMHEPAELSQNKVHRLKFDNPFTRSASLISGWWLLYRGEGRSRPGAACPNCVLPHHVQVAAFCSVMSQSWWLFAQTQSEEGPPPLLACWE